MKKIFYIACCFVFLSGAYGFCQESVSPEAAAPVSACSETELGIRIHCDPDWPVTRQLSRVTFYIAKEDGKEVTVSISRSRESGVLFEDLTPSTMQNVYDYADHFKYSHLDIGGKKAISIIGHPRASANTQLLDYFILKDMILYRVSFSVLPQKDFAQYDHLFEEMILSFEFI